jgi:hypothetical protein
MLHLITFSPYLIPRSSFQQPWRRTINSLEFLSSEVLRRYVKYMRGRVQSDARERDSDKERRKE